MNITFLDIATKELKTLFIGVPNLIFLTRNIKSYKARPYNTVITSPMYQSHWYKEIITQYRFQCLNFAWEMINHFIVLFFQHFMISSLRHISVIIWRNYVKPKNRSRMKNNFSVRQKVNIKIYLRHIVIKK